MRGFTHKSNKLFTYGPHVKYLLFYSEANFAVEAECYLLFASTGIWYIVL